MQVTLYFHFWVADLSSVFPIFIWSTLKCWARLGWIFNETGMGGSIVRSSAKQDSLSPRKSQKKKKRANKPKERIEWVISLRDPWHSRFYPTHCFISYFHISRISFALLPYTPFLDLLKAWRVYRSQTLSLSSYPVVVSKPWSTFYVHFFIRIHYYGPLLDVLLPQVCIQCEQHRWCEWWQVHYIHY